jgi:hypothetical protein
MGRRNRQKGVLSATRGCAAWLLFLVILVVLGACAFVWLKPIQQVLANVIATPTPQPTPTPAPDFAAIIDQFRRAESAAVTSALDERNADVMAALAVFASGDALSGIQKQVASLQRNDRFENFTLEKIEVEQVVPDSPTLVKLLTNETHRRETYAREAGGDSKIGTEHYQARIAYQLVYDGLRWRVDDLGIAETTPLSE